MIAFVPALLAKITVIFAGALILTALIRGASSLRHLVLLAALACGLTLPLAMLVLPRWDVRVLPAPAPVSNINAPAPAENAADINGAPAAGGASPAPTTNVATEERARISVTSMEAWFGPATTLALIWALGFFAVVAWLATGRLHLRRIAREAWPLTNGDWQRILDAVRSEAGVTREVRLFSSSVVSTPLTWGTRAPIILLPEDALDWADDHRRVVLRHEVAHIARSDSLSQLVAGLVCAIYWFHPLAWITERRLRAECERACDDRVVSLGTPAADYAAHLLEVARAARSFGAPGFLSVAMARPSQLEGRLLAVLNGSRDRITTSPSARRAAIAISALILFPLAAFRPVPRTGLTKAVSSKTVRDVAPQMAAKPGDNSLKAADKAERSISAYDPAKKFDSTFQLSAPVRSGGTLYIDLKTGGGITISPWDRPEVQVRARLAGRSWRDTRVTLEPSNGDATLKSDFTRFSNNQSSSHDFDIQLPRQFNVRIRSAGGAIAIANMSGEFSGETGGGEVTIRSVNGRVDISTGGGEVNVSDSNLDGSVSTGGGQVRVIRVNGNFRGSSGSGPVIYQGSNRGKGYGIGYGSGSTASASASGSGSASASVGDGPITMTQAGGSIYLPSAPSGASVSTGGGRIVIGSSGGAVHAETGGGDIEIGPSQGSVDASTGAGNVAIDFRGAGSVDVTSGSGRVLITTPRDLNATLELTTAYTNSFRGKTRIISDWPVNVTESQEWDTSHGTPRRYVRVRQQVGRGGPLIRVDTVNGDIVLRKGS